jgi:hypothetical protein
MRFSEPFVVGAAPETVFDYMTNPANLRDWQTSKTSVQQLSDGPPGLGTPLRERTKPPGEGELRGPTRFLAPIVQRVMARQFAGYHRNLCENLQRG